MSFPEQDWRLLRTLHRAALDRYCERVMEECTETIRSEGTSHDRYLRLYSLLETRDKALGQTFNDLRRATALECLGKMVVLGVVTPQELDQFSASTRDSVKILAELWTQGDSP